MEPVLIDAALQASITVVIDTDTDARQVELAIYDHTDPTSPRRLGSRTLLDSTEHATAGPHFIDVLATADGALREGGFRVDGEWTVGVDTLGIWMAAALVTA